MDRTLVAVAVVCPAIRPGRTGVGSAYHPLGSRRHLQKKKRVWNRSGGKRFPTSGSSARSASPGGLSATPTGVGSPGRSGAAPGIAHPVAPSSSPWHALSSSSGAPLPGTRASSRGDWNLRSPEEGERWGSGAEGMERRAGGSEPTVFCFLTPDMLAGGCGARVPDRRRKGRTDGGGGCQTPGKEV